MELRSRILQKYLNTHTHTLFLGQKAKMNLQNPLIKVKEESEKAGLQLNSEN